MSWTSGDKVWKLVLSFHPVDLRLKLRPFGRGGRRGQEQFFLTWYNHMGLLALNVLVHNVESFLGATFMDLSFIAPDKGSVSHLLSALCIS